MRPGLHSLVSRMYRTRPQIGESGAVYVCVSVCLSVFVNCCTSVGTYYTTTHTHTHPFNGPLSGTTRVSRYQKGKTNLDFTEARDSEWQWNPLGRMQVCTSFQTDNHASTPPLSFLQVRCPSCRHTNCVKALKATKLLYNRSITNHSNGVRMLQSTDM